MLYLSYCITSSSASKKRQN